MTDKKTEALAEKPAQQQPAWRTPGGIPRFKSQPAQQEPVATGKQFLQVEELLKDMLDTLPYNSPDYWISRIKEVLPLYTSQPASKPWVKLTKPEKKAVLQKTAEGIDSGNIIMTHWPLVANAIETAVIEKNNG